MWQSVREAFFPITNKLEGTMYHPYVDILNLVTTGMGNLVDGFTPGTPKGGQNAPSPESNAALERMAVPLGWIVGTSGAGAPPPDGPFADKSFVRSELAKLKSNPTAWKMGGGNQAKLTQLRLPQSEMYALVNSKLDEFERTLRNRIPSWDNLPSDAQLAVLLMAWAMGPGFRYPSFINALGTGDFDRAVTESTIPGEATNRGLIPRNAVNKQLLTNAGQAMRAGAPLDQLILDVSSFAKKSAAQIQAAATEAAHIVQKNPGKSALGVTVALVTAGYGSLFLYKNRKKLANDKVTLAKLELPILDGVKL